MSARDTQPGGADDPEQARAHAAPARMMHGRHPHTEAHPHDRRRDDRPHDPRHDARHDPHHGTRHENWRDRLLGYATVTATSALIWFWASNQTRHSADVNCRVHFIPGSVENQLVGPEEPVSVRVQLLGSKVAVDRAVSALNGRTLDIAVGTLGVPSDTGGHDVALADVLAQMPLIAESGATVRAVQPTSATVAIEALTRRDASIAPRFGAARTSGETAIDPSKATVLVPSVIADKLPSTLVVEAAPSAEMLALLEPGRRHQVEVPLVLPPEVAALVGRARIDPPTARIVFTLESAERTLALRQVAVQVAAATGELAGRSVTLSAADEFLRDVVLAGPEDSLRAIERGEAKVIAIVHLAREDFARRTSRKEVTVWMLPPGVRVVSVAGAPTSAPSVGVEIGETK
jgi:hypothetical protein